MHFGRRCAGAVDLTQSGLWAVFKIVNHMPMESIFCSVAKQPKREANLTRPCGADIIASAICIFLHGVVFNQRDNFTFGETVALCQRVMAPGLFTALGMHVFFY